MPLTITSQWRLLIIDDNPKIHDDIRQCLIGDTQDDDLSALEADLFGVETRPSPVRPSYKIDSAYAGAEGLTMVTQAIAEHRPYAMAFVDMRMPPGWDGLETIQHLWRVDPALHIVICTAFSDHTHADIVAQLGASERLLVLKKPFDGIEIIQMVYALCQRCGIQREIIRQLQEAQGATDTLSDHLVTLVEWAPEPLISIRDNRILYWNQAAERMFGYSKSEIIGQPLSQLMSPQDLAQAESCQRRLSQGQSGVRFRCRLHARDDRLIDVLVAIAAMPNTGDSAAALVLSIHTPLTADIPQRSAIARRA